MLFNDLIMDGILYSEYHLYTKNSYFDIHELSTLYSKNSESIGFLSLISDVTFTVSLFCNFSDKWNVLEMVGVIVGIGAGVVLVTVISFLILKKCSKQRRSYALNRRTLTSRSDMYKSIGRQKNHSKQNPEHNLMNDNRGVYK